MAAARPTRVRLQARDMAPVKEFHPDPTAPLEAPRIGAGQRAKWCPTCNGGAGAWRAPSAFNNVPRRVPETPDAAGAPAAPLVCARCVRQHHAAERTRRRLALGLATRQPGDSSRSAPDPFPVAVAEAEAQSGVSQREWVGPLAFWHEVVTARLIELARARGDWKDEYDVRIASGAPRPADDDRPSTIQLVED